MNFIGKFIDRHKNISLWKLLIVAILMSEILTAALNAVQTYIHYGSLTGKHSREIFIVGAIDAFVVALIVTAIVLSIFHASRENERNAKLQVMEYIRDKEASERRYRAVVEDQTEMVCRFSPDGALTFANSSYRAAFARSRRELLGTPFLGAGAMGVPDSVAERFNTLTPLSPLTTFEHEHVPPGGSGVQLQRWTGRAIYTEGGHLIEYQAVGCDITTQREAERYRRRISVLQEREEICRWLHDDIGSDLFNISLITDIIQQKQARGPEVHGFLDWVSDASRNALNSVRSYINFAEQVGPSIGDLVAYIQDYGGVLFSNKEIDFDFSADVDEESVPLAPMKSFSVYLIYKEAITNILKHAQARAVKVRLKACAGQLDLTVQDDGKGFDYGKVSGQKYGTSNIRHRAEIIGGEVVLDSQPGGGTRVRLTVPV